MKSELQLFIKILTEELDGRAQQMAASFPRALPDKEYLVLCGKAQELDQIYALIKVVEKRVLKEVDDE